MQRHATPDASTGPRPVFIIGAPRSATSALTWALGQHPNIQTMPETAWIASMAVGAYLSHVKGSERGKFSHLSNVDYPLEPFLLRVGESIDRIVHDVFATRCEQMYGDWRALGTLREYPNSPAPELRVMRSVDDPKQRWVDGTPMNTGFLWILAEMFPRAMFIHNLRAPGDVATSLEGFATVGADPQPLNDGLQTWINHTENAWFAERAFGAGRVFRADFARIANDQERLLRETCAFLGEDFSADTLKPLERKINSSEVDERREQNLEKLQELPTFQTAESLYTQVSAQPIGPGGDEEAAGVLKQRFLDYVRERSIV